MRTKRRSMKPGRSGNSKEWRETERRGRSKSCWLYISTKFVACTNVWSSFVEASSVDIGCQYYLFFFVYKKKEICEVTLPLFVPIQHEHAVKYFLYIVHFTCMHTQPREGERGDWEDAQYDRGGATCLPQESAKDRHKQTDQGEIQVPAEILPPWCLLSGKKWLMYLKLDRSFWGSKEQIFKHGYANFQLYIYTT